MSRHAIVLICGCLTSCKGGDKAAEPAKDTTQITQHTVNEFMGGGTPTFVLGTQGDERSDRVIAAQVQLVRDLLPSSTQITDVTIHPDDATSWPARPVLYGASHVNSVMATVEDSLPLSISAGELLVAGIHFDGEYQVVAVIPEQPTHPEFLLFAGTGTPGIAEINAIGIGPDPIVIADAFGRLHTGSFGLDSSGDMTVKLSPKARRIQWRRVVRDTMVVAFVNQLPARDDEAQIVEDCEEGLALTIEKLGVADAASITIYVSPDQRSKQSLTGKGGDGHAVPEFQVLHVVAASDHRLRGLVAHEATHLLAYAAFGQAATAVLGEGIAVWVAGQYASTSINDFAKTLQIPRSIPQLLGAAFRDLPEAEAYMHACWTAHTSSGWRGWYQKGRCAYPWGKCQNLGSGLPSRWHHLACDQSGL